MIPAIQDTKILAVDTSPAMLEVLKNFASKQAYDFVGYSDPEDAVGEIGRRVEQLEQGYRCVLLGWPQGDVAIMSNLLSSLNSAENSDLPLIIIGQEITPEIALLTKQRPRTTALLWTNYQLAAEQIERLPLVRKAPVARLVREATVASEVFVRKAGRENPIRALLIDDVPAFSHKLSTLMIANGYEVLVAESVEVAYSLLCNQQFDLIVTDYQLHEVHGMNELASFCEYMNWSSSSSIVIVVSNKYTDMVIKDSLAAGGVACLFKNESSDLLFARVQALVSSLPRSPISVENQADVSLDLTEDNKASLVVAKTSESQAAIVDQALDFREHEESEATDVVTRPIKDSEAAGESVCAEEFVAALAGTLEAVAGNEHGGVRYSVVMLDVQIEASTGDRMSIGDSEPMCRIVERNLGRLYKRPRSLSYLGNGQFVLLLANRRFQDALVLTRTVLQVVPRMVRYLNNMALVSHSSVVRIDGTTTNPQEVLAQCRVAVAKSRKDGRDNCALVLPIQKYLTAPDAEGKAVEAELG